MVEPSLKYWKDYMEGRRNQTIITHLTYTDCVELGILLEELQKLREDKNE